MTATVCSSISISCFTTDWRGRGAVENVGIVVHGRNAAALSLLFSFLLPLGFLEM